MRGGSVPKNFVSFFTLEGLDRAGSSESLINGWDCDLTIAMLVCVLSAAISPLMFSISCEYLVVVSFGNSCLSAYSIFHSLLSLFVAFSSAFFCTKKGVIRGKCSWSFKSLSRCIKSIRLGIPRIVATMESEYIINTSNSPRASFYEVCRRLSIHFEIC